MIKSVDEILLITKLLKLEKLLFYRGEHEIKR